MSALTDRLNRQRATRGKGSTVDQGAYERTLTQDRPTVDDFNARMQAEIARKEAQHNAK